MNRVKLTVTLRLTWPVFPVASLLPRAFQFVKLVQSETPSIEAFFTALESPRSAYTYLPYRFPHQSLLLPHPIVLPVSITHIDSVGSSN